MKHSDQALYDLILQNVPEDGTSIGNKKLLGLLTKKANFSFTEDAYFRICDDLIKDGLLAKGRGRGGSVMRTNVSSGDDINEDEGFGLELQQRPDPEKAESITL